MGEYARGQCGGSSRADYTAEVPGGQLFIAANVAIPPWWRDDLREEAAGGQRDSG